MSSPIQLANKVIRTIADNLLSEDVVVGKDDYLAMRVVYRQLGGRWEPILQGDSRALGQLKEIVTAWGNMPGRIRESEDGDV